MSRIIILLLLSSVLAACASTRHLPGPATAPRPATPAGPAKTAPYEVFGEKYYPVTDATGYRARGVASWYGGKFHGRKTANGERYDMYKYTAAHTTLPLPTHVRVTNLRNGANVIVRVNDRGPFVKNRLIDLSYAAALKLGMIEDGTTLVEVEAIGPAAASYPVPAPAVMTARPVVQETVTTTYGIDPASPTAEVAANEAAPAAAGAETGAAVIYVQVGAFGERGNAQRLQDTLYNAGIADVRLDSGSLEATPIHRVQIGPIAGVLEYDVLIAQLDAIGIRDTHLVTE